jgi:hypothetical protein
VARRDVAHVHEVQPRVHVGGHLPIQEVHDHLPGRRGLDVPLPDGCGGVHDHDRQSLAGPGVRHALGVVLGLLVVADDAVPDDGRRLVRGAAVHEAEGRDRARVDDLRDIRVGGGAQDVLGAIDVGAVEVAAMARPESVVGGDVVERRGSLRRPGEGGRIGQVPFDDLNVEAREIVPAAAASGQAPHGVPPRQKGPNDVGADETGAACDEVHWR